jgi:hypothetical protein
MNIGLSLFGVLAALSGLNWIVFRRQWGQKAFKATPLWSRKVYEVFFLVVGILLVMAGIAMVMGGLFGGP